MESATETGLDASKLPNLPLKAAKRPKVKKAAKPKAKPAKKVAKKVAYAGKAKRKPKVMAANARTERLDMRLTKAEKAKVHTRASKLRRTVTSVIIEAIEKIK